jgi:hypothetical protein
MLFFAKLNIIFPTQNQPQIEVFFLCNVLQQWPNARQILLSEKLKIFI